MNRYFYRVKYTSDCGTPFVFPCTVEAESEPEARSTVDGKFADMYPKAHVTRVEHYDTVHNIGRQAKRSSLVG